MLLIARVQDLLGDGLITVKVLFLESMLGFGEGLLVVAGDVILVVS